MLPEDAKGKKRKKEFSLDPWEEPSPADTLVWTSDPQNRGMASAF